MLISFLGLIFFFFFPVLGSVHLVFLNLTLTSLILPQCLQSLAHISVSIAFGPLVSGAFRGLWVFILGCLLLEEPNLF